MSWGGASGLRTARGEVNVVERVVGYKKIKFHTHENVGYGDVVLPEMQLPTTAWWVAFPEEIVRLAGVERPVFLDALRGIAGAMHTVASLGLMIDPRDLGWTLSEDPAIYLYDHVAGGIGLAPRLYEDRESVLRRAFELIAGCGCDDGCPACVGPVVESARKRVALDVLRLLGIGAVV
jgi:DEAD/DEAH box helicase domain-containing protein